MYSSLFLFEETYRLPVITPPGLIFVLGGSASLAAIILADTSYKDQDIKPSES